MAAVIPYFIAGISTIAFITLWFVIAHRELACKKQGVTAATEQVKMHRTLYMQERGGPNEKFSKRMLDTSYMIYSETAKDYNKSLMKPVFRIPGLVMGFRAISEKEP